MTSQDKKDMDVLASVINASVQRGVFDTMIGVVQVNNAMANLIGRLDTLAMLENAKPAVPTKKT